MIWLVLGRREQGKTTLAMSMALRVPQRLIFDPRAMIRPNDARAEDAGQLAAMMDKLYHGEINEVRFTPTGDVEEGFHVFASAAAAWVREDASRPLAVLIDESGFLQRSDRVAPFMWLCRCSRRDVVQIIMTAHRPRDISTSVRAIADHWLIYACRQEHDLRVIEERCSLATLAAVQRLGERQFVAWDDARGKSKLYPFPDKWYVNLADPKLPEASLDESGDDIDERRGLF